MHAAARHGTSSTNTGSKREIRSMKSPVVKRSIVIAGHKTSVSLEDAFWKGLKEIASGRDMTLSDLVATIDSERRHGNLSSAIRLFVLDYYRVQATGQTADKDASLETSARVPPSLLRAG
jgi:predicted DNA-binding ribbon-helix-helix protein